MRVSVGFELETLDCALVYKRSCSSSKSKDAFDFYLNPVAASARRTRLVVPKENEEKDAQKVTMEVYGDRMPLEVKMDKLESMSIPESYDSILLSYRSGERYKVTKHSLEDNPASSILNDLEFVITFGDPVEIEGPESVVMYILELFERSISLIKTVLKESVVDLIESSVVTTAAPSSPSSSSPLPWPYGVTLTHPQMKKELILAKTKNVYSRCFFHPQLTLGLPLQEVMACTEQLYLYMPSSQDDTSEATSDVFMYFLNVCRNELDYFSEEGDREELLKNFFFLFVLHLLTANEARKVSSEIIVRESFQDLKRMLTAEEKKKMGTALVQFEGDYTDFVTFQTRELSAFVPDFNFHENVTVLGRDILFRNVSKKYERQFLVDVGVVPANVSDGTVFLEFRAFSYLFFDQNTESPSLKELKKRVVYLKQSSKGEAG